MSELYATIDLGSNSFHLLISSLAHNEMKIMESTSDKVCLAEKLDKKKGIHPDAMQRGLECASRFAQRIEHIPKKNVRIVGTNTLRAAVNADSYVEQLEAIFKDHNIDVVSGIEEARLIYLGVSHCWSAMQMQHTKLVIDIGGGSTEFIIGKDFEQKKAESLRMGCVSYRRFFADDKISHDNFTRALKAAKYEVANIQAEFSQKNWDDAVGSAGTFKALENVLVEQGLTDEGITLEGLKAIKKQLLTYDSMLDAKIPGLKTDRQLTILPGLAVALAVFDSLKIKRLEIARGGMREGILYDLLGRQKSEDIRERSIQAISERYHVSQQKILLLQKISSHLLNNAIIQNKALKDQPLINQITNQQTTANQPSDNNFILDETFFQEQGCRFLKWAVQCSTIGLAINHSQYHIHSAYLIENSELSGFSLKERQLLAALVINQRRKLTLSELESIPLKKSVKYQFYIIIILLRLTLILAQKNNSSGINKISMAITTNKFVLTLDGKWLNQNSLVKHALAIEKHYWQKTDWCLDIIS